MSADVAAEMVEMAEAIEFYEETRHQHAPPSLLKQFLAGMLRLCVCMVLTLALSRSRRAYDVTLQSTHAVSYTHLTLPTN